MEDGSKRPRRTSRHRMLFAAAIGFGTTSIPCTIRNISETGAAIEVNSPLWFPEQFTLRMDRDGSRRPCHVVWRREKRIGVQFDELCII
jgi:PilZ domain